MRTLLFLIVTGLLVVPTGVEANADEVLIDIEPDSMNFYGAPWVLCAPWTGVIGNGDWHCPNQETGCNVEQDSGGCGLYIIDWGEVEGWTAPDEQEYEFEPPATTLYMFGEYVPAGADVADPPVVVSNVFDSPAPNPFRTETSVHFDLPDRRFLAAHVFSPKGSLIRVLEPGGVYGPGGHEISWLGEDEPGHPVPSGIYLLRIRSGSREEIRGVSLIRKYGTSVCQGRPFCLREKGGRPLAGASGRLWT